MQCQAVYFVAVATVLSQSAAELIIAARDTESKVGDTTYLNCSTDVVSEEIFWHHGNKYIYTGDAEGILEPYRGRFEIDRNASNGSHNLVIKSVQPSDAGKYMCVDRDGIGSKRSAELVVLDNDPNCESNVQPDGVIGQNSFDIPPDEVELRCTAIYQGNIPPQMEWKKVGDNSSIDDKVTYNATSKNRVVYTLRLKGDISLDKSSYVCQTRRSSQGEYKCKSETIKALYFIGGNFTKQSVVRGDEITCMAKNSTFSCINQWYHNNKSCPLSCDENITTHLLGEYVCTVKCTVRGIDYSFQALIATVIESTTSTPPSTSGIVAAAVLTPAAILILAALIVVFVVRHKQRAYREGLERLNEKKQLELDFVMARTAYANYSKLQGKIDAEEEFALLHKIKSKQTGEDNAISGVAILDEKLFIVREKRLEIYESKNFAETLKSLNVKGLVAAVDLCACKTFNCLYIMDKKKGASKGIVKIDAEGNFLKTWLTKKNASGNLSTTEEGNVIITVQEKQRLLEYSPKGQLVCTIKLPECNNPWHAMKLDNDRYIVSHGILTDTVIRVCLVDRNGDVKKSSNATAKTQLNMPVHLAVGGNGYVIVADNFSNRVLLLDSELEFKRDLVPKYKQRFRNPRRVCVVQALFVVVIAAGCPTEIIPEEAEDSSEEGEDGDNAAENIELVRKAKKGQILKGDPLIKIDEDCRLLVFDSKPLVDIYDWDKNAS